MIGTAGRRAWLHVISFFAFLPDVRRVLSTTHALESVHARLRTVIKTRGHFPNDDAASTLLWHALRNITRDWTAPGAAFDSREDPVRVAVRRSLHDAERAEGRQPERMDGSLVSCQPEMNS